MSQVTSLKKFFITASTILAILFAISPALVFADASPLTTQKKTVITYECGDGATAGNCNFADLINATKHVVDFGVTLAISFSVLVIVFA